MTAVTAITLTEQAVTIIHGICSVTHSTVGCMVHSMVLLLLLSLFCPVGGNFVKDQRIDAHVFPPVVEREIRGVPRGHLRPLGYQRPPDGRVKVAAKDLRLTTFYEKAVLDRKPFVVTEQYTPPAYEDWNDKYLARVFGNTSARVYEGGLKNKKLTHSTMRLARFLRKYNYEEWYLKSPLPEEMKDELTLPFHLQCPAQLQNLQSVHYWLASGMASSRVFYEADDQMHCLLSGRADFFLTSQKYAPIFSIEDSPHMRSGSGFSKMDIEMINMYDNPEISDIHWKWASIKKGDCLFIPAGLIQQVRTYGRALSIIFKLTPLPEYPSCGEDIQAMFHPLNKTKTFWITNRTELFPSVEKWTPELLDWAFSSLLRASDKLYIEQWAHFHANAVTKTGRPNFATAWGSFREVLDHKLRGYVTREELDSLNYEKRLWLCEKLNGDTRPIPYRDEL